MFKNQILKNYHIEQIKRGIDPFSGVSIWTNDFFKKEDLIGSKVISYKNDYEYVKLRQTLLKTLDFLSSDSLGRKILHSIRDNYEASKGLKVNLSEIIERENLNSDEVLNHLNNHKLITWIEPETEDGSYLKLLLEDGRVISFNS